MEQLGSISRRAFLADLGRGSVALLVVSVAACATGSTASPMASSGASGTAAGRSPTPIPSGGSSPSASTAAGGGGASPSGGLAWTRVNLGFVSAYILAHGGEAAIIDTGVGGSVDEIEAAMTRAGLAWSNVGHLILTHHHGDHVGSAQDDAGAADVPKINLSRPLRTVADGDTVMGLRIVTTPGHTLGHVAVFDEAARVLVAGDALGTVGGPLAGSNPAFTADAAAAKASIAKLAGLQFDTLLVGHGDPILTGASAQVATLAAAR